jgi:hypothetical protein
MGRHLLTCKIRKDKNELELKGRKKYQIYHLKISGSQWYWLHIDIPASATLMDLDKFLRGIWLECCGHLSAFTIKDVRYDDVRLQKDYSVWSPPSNSMNKRLYTVLNVKDSFSHEYDFGSTTHLKVHVLAVREGYLGKNNIHILARNNPYIFECDDCGKRASGMCLECEGFICDECLEGHECGEEMIIDVANSPRMGMCGYGGPDTVDDWTS